MRVLLLNYEYPPAGGGAGNATCNIAKKLASMGVDTEVLTAKIEPGDVDGAVVDGVRVWRVPSWRKGIHDCGLVGAYSWVAYAAWRRRKLHKAKPYDLEHFFFSLPTASLTRLPFQGRIPPYVVSLRGSDVPGYDPFNKTVERMHKVLRPITRRIWRDAAAVVALSDGLREIAVETAPEQQFGVIPNGIETALFRPGGARRRPGDGPLRLVCVSRLLERKGIHFLLEAIARPSPLDVELTIIGTGSYEETLRRRCAELGLDDRVRFTGFVRREELPQHYRKADLFALPSLTESFGLVFAEAMACRLPVLATIVGGIPALVRNGIDGVLVEPGSAAPLRAALERMLARPAQLVDMADNALRRIEENFTWDIVARRYLECYENVLARAREPKCVASPVS
jgi:glycosyltransferase involved in cell wall biosynthesis